MGNTIDFVHRFPSLIWKETNPSRKKMKLYFQIDVMDWKRMINKDYELWKQIRKSRIDKEISFCTWNVQTFHNPNDEETNIQSLMNFISNELFVDILCLQEYPLKGKIL